jgi:hypothetical protein
MDSWQLQRTYKNPRLDFFFAESDTPIIISSTHKELSRTTAAKKQVQESYHILFTLVIEFKLAELKLKK